MSASSVETEPELFDVPQAAAKLRVGKDTVYAKVNAGDWPHTRLTRKISFTQEQIDTIKRMAAVEPVISTPRRRKAS